MAVESINSMVNVNQTKVNTESLKTDFKREAPEKETRANTTKIEDITPKDDKTVAETAEVSQEKIKKAVETINKNLPNSEAIFGFHEGTNRVTIKIVDKDTREVIKELPPEKTLDMIAKAWELAGLLVDERR